jgi:hypothetical protein
MYSGPLNDGMLQYGFHIRVIGVQKNEDSR